MRSPKRPSAQRGAALSETALVVGVILIMILGSVQLGIVGYVQMTADAAAWMSAHQATVGDVNAITATSGVFPQVQPTDFYATAAPAPVPTVYVDYGYNDPSGAVRAASVNNRHGGATMMEPSQLTSTVTKSNVGSILGIPLSVQGSMIEPQWMENGAHFDVANSDSYGQSGANFQVNYFSSGENTPPYYVGFNYISNCPDPQPWGSTANKCNGVVQYRALSMAEHLDDSVWPLPDGEISATPVAFAQVACHQRVFSTIATFFANNSTLSALQYTAGAAINPMDSGDYSTWPRDGSASSTHGGFFYSPSVAGPVTGQEMDDAIAQVYSWDVLVNGGYPPSTYTGVGSYPFPKAGAESTGQPYVYGINC